MNDIYIVDMIKYKMIWFYHVKNRWQATTFWCLGNISLTKYSISFRGCKDHDPTVDTSWVDYYCRKHAVNRHPFQIYNIFLRKWDKKSGRQNKKLKFKHFGHIISSQSGENKEKYKMKSRKVDV